MDDTLYVFFTVVSGLWLAIMFHDIAKTRGRAMQRGDYTLPRGIHNLIPFLWVLYTIIDIFV